MNARLSAFVVAFSLVALAAPARAQDGSLLGSDLHAASVQAGENVVFVSDGYPPDEQASFLSDAKEMARRSETEGSAAPMRQAKPFNYHFVFVPSTDRGAPYAAGAPAGSTPFKSGLGADGLLHADNAAADAAAAKYAPDVDVVVIVTRFADGAPDGPSSIRANSDIHNFGSRIRIPRDCAGAFVHELGHAIYSLGDEYNGRPGPIPDLDRRALALFPNLTFDATGARWAAIVPGAVPGGAEWNDGIWHPTERCRMNQCWDPDCPFCPVCLAQMSGSFPSKPGTPTIAGKPGAGPNGDTVVTVQPGPGSPPVSYYVSLQKGDQGFFGTSWSAYSWMRAEPQGAVDLGNLPPGHYELGIMATNLAGDSTWTNVEFDVGNGGSSRATPHSNDPTSPYSTPSASELEGVGAPTSRGTPLLPPPGGDPGFAEPQEPRTGIVQVIPGL